MVASLTANKLREDVNTVFPGTGKYHGFEGTISVKKFGNQPIYAYAQNIGSGTENPNLSQSPKTIYISEKANNPIKAKAISKTVNYSTVKKKAVTVKTITVSKAQGSVSYKKTSGKNFFTVNSKTGKITIKKGTKKGAYKINVKVSAAGNNNYKSKSVKKTVTIKVK